MEQKVEQKNHASEGHIGNTVPRESWKKARNWCFTLNHYTQIDIGTIYDEKLKLNLIQFCFQEEIGPSGTPHLQGTLAYKNAISFNTMKKLLPRAHWSRARNLKNALAYCCKVPTRNGKVWFHNYEPPVELTDNMILEDMCEQMTRRPL